MDISIIQRPIRKELAAVRRAVHEILVPEILDSPTAERLTSLARDSSIAPSVFLLTALANNGIKESGISTAAGCELFHLATRVHDAVIDGIMVEGWTPEWMIINGDHIFAEALTLLLSGSERAGNATSRMVSRMALGEIQYVREDADSSPEEHIDMITNKYGSLLETSAELAALEGNLAEESISAIIEYGSNLGTAYEIGNEILDFEESVHKGRAILPLLYQTDNHATRNLLIERKDAEGLKQWCADNGCFEKSKSEAEQYVKRALLSLSKSGIKLKAMEDLCLWIGQRTDG